MEHNNFRQSSRQTNDLVTSSINYSLNIMLIVDQRVIASMSFACHQQDNWDHPNSSVGILFVGYWRSEPSGLGWYAGVTWIWPYWPILDTQYWYELTNIDHYFTTLGPSLATLPKFTRHHPPLHPCCKLSRHVDSRSEMIQGSVGLAIGNWSGRMALPWSRTPWMGDMEIPPRRYGNMTCQPGGPS